MKLKNSINLENVNHLILKKQHLSPDSKTDDIKKIVDDIIGLHATGQQTPYLSLFVRMNNFKRQWLRDEMEVKRNFGKIRCMRRTVHVLSKDMIPVAYTATKKFVVPGTESYVKHLGVTYEDFKIISESILDIVKLRRGHHPFPLRSNGWHDRPSARYYISCMPYSSNHQS